MNVKRLIRHAFVFAFLLNSILVLTFVFGAGQIGFLQAKYDIYRGRYKVKGYGLMPFFGCGGDYWLLRAYGIECQAVAGCVVNDFIIDYVRNYNAVMRPVIREKFDIDIDGWKQGGSGARDAGDVIDTAAEAAKAVAKQRESPLEIFVSTAPAGGDEAHHLTECLQSLRVDLGAGQKEVSVCLRELETESPDLPYGRKSLVVDLLDNGALMLRQELDSAVFWEEQYLAFRDLDGDGRKELITNASFGPRCAGERPLRIYRYDGESFDLAASIVGLVLSNPLIGDALALLGRVGDLPLQGHAEDPEMKTAKKCGEFSPLAAPWIVDSDHDGLPEILVLYSGGARTVTAEDCPCRLRRVRVGPNGAGPAEDFEIPDLKNCDAAAEMIGFLTPRDHRAHLLINRHCGGTDTGSPVLHIYDVRNDRLEKIGEFAGFYTHAIPWRLADYDRDGDTEIVYVKGTYWPPGKPHAEVMMEYGIAEYRSGKYVAQNRAQTQL